MAALPVQPAAAGAGLRWPGARRRRRSLSERRAAYQSGKLSQNSERIVAFYASARSRDHWL